MSRAGIVLFSLILLVITTPVTLAEMQDEGEVVVVTVDSTRFRFTPDTITIQEGDSFGKKIHGNQRITQ